MLCNILQILLSLCGILGPYFLFCLNINFFHQDRCLNTNLNHLVLLHSLSVIQINIFFKFIYRGTELFYLFIFSFAMGFEFFYLLLLLLK